MVDEFRRHVAHLVDHSYWTLHYLLGTTPKKEQSVDEHVNRLRKLVEGIGSHEHNQNRKEPEPIDIQYKVHN